MTALTLEAAGFTRPGTGLDYADSERIGLAGELPLVTFGGLKARGHPVGASGCYQIVEAYQQLTERAGANQVKGAGVALTQNIGGTGATVVSHVLARAD
jgi:acetyl-CoA C-acetyltransferase